MTDDWTKEIRERLEKATDANTPPWDSKILRSSDRSELIFLNAKGGFFMDYATHSLMANAPTDIARLLEEREILREALSFYADALNAVGSAMKYDMGYRAKDALAYVPEGVEE